MDRPLPDGKFTCHRSVIGVVLLQDMAKYLRDAEIRGFLREPTCESDSNRITYLTGCENWFTGAAMYFRKALPVQCFGVQKLNIYGCPNAETICDESTLGIANVWVNVPSIVPSSLDNCKSQQAFALELAHAGIIAASKRFEFNLAVFDEAKMSVEENDYVLSYEIGKSKASPDRKYTAAVFCRYDNRYITELRVMQKDGTLQCLYHFANGNENSIGQLRWDACDKIRIPLTAVTGDAHWDCYLDGRIRFVFPKSETGDSHQLYQHAILLLDGAFVVPDRIAGMDLLERSAKAGYKHAIRRLQREQQNQAMHAEHAIRRF